MLYFKQNEKLIHTECFFYEIGNTFDYSFDSIDNMLHKHYSEDLYQYGFLTFLYLGEVCLSETGSYNKYNGYFIHIGIYGSDVIIFYNLDGNFDSLPFNKINKKINLLRIDTDKLIHLFKLFIEKNYTIIKKNLREEILSLERYQKLQRLYVGEKNLNRAVYRDIFDNVYPDKIDIRKSLSSLSDLKDVIPILQKMNDMIQKEIDRLNKEIERNRQDMSRYSNAYVCDGGGPGSWKYRRIELTNYTCCQDIISTISPHRDSLVKAVNDINRYINEISYIQSKDYLSEYYNTVKEIAKILNFKVNNTFCSEKQKLVLDGSNIALYNANNKDKKTACLNNIQLITNELYKRGYREIILFIDASLRHQVENIAVFTNFISNYGLKSVEVPSGTNADLFIIDYAIKNNAIIVTNDKFRDHIESGKITLEFLKTHKLNYVIVDNQALIVNSND